MVAVAASEAVTAAVSGESDSHITVAVLQLF